MNSSGNNHTSGPDSPARTRSSVTFGARAAVLAGVVVTTCAVGAASAAHATAGHPAAHIVTAAALGATTVAGVTPMDTTCCG
jgi:hypothetical protein